MKQTYIEFICELIKKEEMGKPIYTNEISDCISKEYNITIKKATGATSVACKRIIDSEMIPDLRFYQKGIYYRVTVTPFGETNIDKEQLIEDKYLKNDIGYETGLQILHRLGLTSQMPNMRTLATNKASDCARLDKKLEIVVRPAKIKVNAENKQYLKMLDVLDILDDAPIDVDDPYKIIGNYIDELGLEYGKLLAMANNYYNKNTVLQLAHVAGVRL